MHDHDQANITECLATIATTLQRIALAIEECPMTLAADSGSRYTSQTNNGLVDEKVMATQLGISPRTLGEHRRRGRLPGCWIRNGGRIYWRLIETQRAWEKGIA